MDSSLYAFIHRPTGYEYYSIDVQNKRRQDHTSYRQVRILQLGPTGTRDERRFIRLDALRQKTCTADRHGLTDKVYETKKLEKYSENIKPVKRQTSICFTGSVSLDFFASLNNLCHNHTLC